ncbi:TPA: dihydrofolate reductase [Klebsiella variicola]
MKMIAAVGRNFEIGRGNALPWHCPSDLKLFKELTHGFIVVMGWNTALSLGKPLAGRKNVVLTRKLEDGRPAGFWHSATFDECQRKFPNGWVIGGAKTYELLLPFVDEVWISHIDIEVKGADSFFPFEMMRQLGFEAVEVSAECSSEGVYPGFKQIVYRKLK